MITRDTFETAARETLLLLEQIAYEGITYVYEDFDATASVDLAEMFENVDGLTDEDLETLHAHEESVWAVVAMRVHAMDPDWEADFKARTFTNETAFSEALLAREEARNEYADMLREYRMTHGFC